MALAPNYSKRNRGPCLGLIAFPLAQGYGGRSQRKKNSHRTRRNRWIEGADWILRYASRREADGSMRWLLLRILHAVGEIQIGGVGDDHQRASPGAQA